MPLSTARSARTVMKGLNKEASQLLAQYRAAKVQTLAQWDQGPAAKRELIATLKAAALAQVSEMQMAHRQAAETFQAEVDRARGKPSPMGVPEQMAWERLRSHLETAAARGSTTPAAQTAMLRLERAQATGDRPMIAAARSMLEDYLGAGPLARDHRRWLDIQAGDAETVEAVGLDEEGRRGIPWTRQAVDWVAGELSGQVDNVGLLPEWEGSTVALDRAPDYQATERAATANAAQILAAAGYRPTSGGTIAKTGGSGPAPAAEGGADGGRPE